MNEQELKLQTDRIFQYNSLKERRDELLANIKLIDADRIVEDTRIKDLNNPPSPFTCDAWNCRKINSLHFYFSPTANLAPATELKLINLNISAYDMGRFIQEQLNKELMKINKEITEL